jgi:hypothetical protein
MPARKSKVNVSKTASAQNQCARAIQSAARGAVGLQFYSVQKATGNGFFTLRDAEGAEVRATPRGLFTRGTMRISVGQIVVAEGNARIGLEIVGVIQERREAQALVDDGVLPRAILVCATAAGSIEATVTEEEDLFENEEDGQEQPDVPDVRGGVRAQRLQAAAIRSVASLASRLSSGKKSGGKGVHVESAAEDVSAAATADAFSVKKKRSAPAAAAAPPRRSIPMRAAISDPAQPSVWDVTSPEEAESEYASEQGALEAAIAALPSADEFDIDAI